MSDALHQPVQAAGLPKPIGPYSPGMVFDRLVIVSGQGATDPATGKLAGPDVETQTRQVFRNMQAILEAGGSDLSKVLRCGVFLVDLRDFEKMNAVYAEVFGDHRPARTTVQVSSLPDPGLRVEIDAIAYRD
ncbi:MAG: Rid family detoxifying hydrolase [Gemmatimonadetes bacterium]|jgi:2-iminobutanoate/2-iminopropanoate deaminase|nr:Rid family detoxifying hydrolase [Gemmatimonadota bacterium]